MLRSTWKFLLLLPPALGACSDPGLDGSGTGGSTAGDDGVVGTGGTGNGTGAGADSGAGTGSGADAGTGSGSTGGGTGGGAGAGEEPNQVFSQCRFHFGAIDEHARNNAALRAEIDYFTPGWMGISNTFDQEYVCDDVNGTLAGKVPVVVAYVAAFYAKREQSLHDCNAGTPNLCTYGAEIIRNDLETIKGIYRSYAQGYANCLGGKPIVFEMEPDWYQYTISEQEHPLTHAEAGQIMGEFVAILKEELPNAFFSMDISPWVPPNNGSDHGAEWFSNFDLSLFTFVNTSGGGTEANNTKIRSSNNMTWAGVTGVTGKTLLADTGYGVNGASAGHDAAWANVDNINARIDDGVIGINQYNPDSNWGNTIASIRSQLKTPAFCP